jgi:ABC-type transport system involved in cytochrome bd biosynthesis fused ATPase/permease subunit
LVAVVVAVGVVVVVVVGVGIVVVVAVGVAVGVAVVVAVVVAVGVGVVVGVGVGVVVVVVVGNIRMSTTTERNQSQVSRQLAAYRGRVRKKLCVLCGGQPDRGMRTCPDCRRRRREYMRRREGFNAYRPGGRGRPPK